MSDEKDPIPEGLTAPEAVEWMMDHHFRNRHSAVGPHLGLLMTYFELLDKQKEKNR